MLDLQVNLQLWFSFCFFLDIIFLTAGALVPRTFRNVIFLHMQTPYVKPHSSLTIPIVAEHHGTPWLFSLAQPVTSALLSESTAHIRNIFCTMGIVEMFIILLAVECRHISLTSASGMSSKDSVSKKRKTSKITSLSVKNYMKFSL